MTTYDDQLDRHEEEMEEGGPPPVSLVERVKYTALSAAVLGGGLELMGTGVTGLILAGVGASAVAYFSPEIKESLERHFGPSVEKASRRIDWRRLASKRYLKTAVPEEQKREEESQPTRREARPKKEGKRDVQNGPQKLEAHREEEREEWDERWYDEEEDVVTPPSTHKTSLFTFSEVLASGFTPTLRTIFLARLPDGTDITVEAKDLCHVALAGLTGNGKSSILRLIMAQLCKIGVRVMLLNPHYMRYDRGAAEDWTPFEPFLEKPAVDCARYENIRLYLRWLVETLLPRRIERARAGKSIGKPFFVVIDELPAIVAEIREAPAIIAKLLREGRKYGIYLVAASQDFLVKTTGMDGGAVRKCFRTAYYVGGDTTTANVLLNDLPEKIPENDLGKGTILLRCAATKKAMLANVPYVENASLYRLLGPSTFSALLEEEEEQMEPLPVYSQINEKQGDKHPVYEGVNTHEGPSGKVIEGVFTDGVINAENHAQKAERVPVNEEIRKHIRRMHELGYPHRDISKIVGLYGPKYGLYRRVCIEEGISIEREA